MARPKLNIDPELVLKLARIQCTTREIAAVCDCSTDTIENRFSAELKKGYEEGKTRLRKGLWELAAKGNLGALIWLSKNHLGMSDKAEIKTEDMQKVKDVLEVSVGWQDETTSQNEGQNAPTKEITLVVEEV